MITGMLAVDVRVIAAVTAESVGTLARANHGQIIALTTLTVRLRLGVPQCVYHILTLPAYTYLPVAL